MSHTFWVAGEPEPQGSSRGFIHPQTGRVIITSDNPDLKKWRRTVAIAAIGGPTFGAHEPVWVRLTFFLTAPQKMPKGRTSWPTTPPDGDKLLRGALDAMTIGNVVVKGKALGLYPDDAQVVHSTWTKRYAGQRGPGVEITVSGTPFDASEPGQARLVAV